MKKKIVYITGTRAEYGVMRDLLREMNHHPSFDLSLIVTGMHTSETYGNTVSEILQDNIPILASLDHNPVSTLADMARTLGDLIIRITDVLEKNTPDIVLVTGDRNEALAGAIAGMHLNTLVAHISGGDTTTGGHIDEITRHVISKYAHIHFPASPAAANILEQMGEDPGRIFVVGNPGVPTKYQLDLIRKVAFGSKYGLDLALPVLIVLQHPCSNGAEDAGRQMRETMEAIKDLDLQTIVIYPNNDAGSSEIIEVIEQYRMHPRIQIHQNLPRDDFLVLMAVAGVIVGNSSAGLIETPAFSLPAVNIGIRQGGRERSENVLDVPHERQPIKEAIIKALYDKDFREITTHCQSPYAKENAEQRIIEILTSLKISESLLRKDYSVLHKKGDRTL
jgi:GDP/UDP-N,N'-diacetylbacillosamine 2-epimerase (hydrolysing)